MLFRNGSIAVVAALAIFAPGGAASAACVPITTAADLNNVRNNLGGNFCLTSDLDLASLSNFTPIGSETAPFTGSFNGQNHVIRRLRIHSAASAVGLFGMVHGGRILNVTLAGVSVSSTRANALVGALVGWMDGPALIGNVKVTGEVGCSGDVCRVGGIVGEAEAGNAVKLSSASALVKGGYGGAAGGLIGQTDGTISQSYASGRVVCGSSCAAGGLAGFAGDQAHISYSFAVGQVIGGGDGAAGGLIGTSYGTVQYSYATGPLRLGANGLDASLIGYHGGRVNRCFAIGRVSAGAGSTVGGLIGVLATAQARTYAGYWDLTTTGRSTSAQGSGLPTTTLQAELPAGFDATWAITKGYSYPFLNIAAMPYVSTVATTVKPGKIYTFLPIGQLEPTEYTTPPHNADLASLAASFTMIARAVGITDNVASLSRETIDQDFWHDATKKTTWSGPITQHAHLGTVVTLGANDTINDSNIIGPLKARKVVVIRGQYDKADNGTADHWMLATLFTANSSNVTTALVANDPWTGQQVFIDPTTRRVTRPANFPLANFRVNGYRVVTLN